MIFFTSGNSLRQQATVRTCVRACMSASSARRQQLLLHVAAFFFRLAGRCCVRACPYAAPARRKDLVRVIGGRAWLLAPMQGTYNAAGRGNVPPVRLLQPAASLARARRVLRAGRWPHFALRRCILSIMPGAFGHRTYVQTYVQVRTRAVHL